MSDSSVRVSVPSSGGKLIDNEQVSGHPDGNVERQRIQVTGASLAEVARVTNAPLDPDAYGMAARIVRDRYQMTPFGQQRVANPYSLGDFVQTYGFDAAVMTKVETNSGTVTDVTAQSATLLTVSGNGDRAQQATREYLRYQPGHAQRIVQTVVLSAAGTANLLSEWGQFDDDDGYIWRHDADTSIVLRSNVTGTPAEVEVAQSAWNVDPMDGTGPSGATLDVTKLNIYELAYQWLGAGLVWWFVNGNLVHVSENPGAYAVPYVATANLPLQWDLSSTGGAGTLTNVCSSVVVEGGDAPLSLGYGSPAALHSVPTTPGETIITLRPKATFNSVKNRAQLIPKYANVNGAGGGSDALIQVVLNPTLTGSPSWVSAGTTSHAEYDVSNTTFTGGQVLAAAFLTNNDNRAIDLREIFARNGRKLLVDSLTGAQDLLSIVGYDLASGTTDVYGQFNWLEVR